MATLQVKVITQYYMTRYCESTVAFRLLPQDNRVNKTRLSSVVMTWLNLYFFPSVTQAPVARLEWLGIHTALSANLILNQFVNEQPDKNKSQFSSLNRQILLTLTFNIFTPTWPMVSTTERAIQPWTPYYWAPKTTGRGEGRSTAQSPIQIRC